MMTLLSACAPASLVDIRPPSTVIASSAVTTPSGAIQFYNAAITKFAWVLGGDPTGNGDGQYDYMLQTGFATDELVRNNVPASIFDMRTWTTAEGGMYLYLHQPRVESRQAREALQRYAPTAPLALQGRMYAQEGYAVLWFAEFFCSGIPLSTVTLDGQSTYTAGFTTDELFAYAVALFDSAILTAADSSRFTNFAKVGKGRALLGLGKFVEAAAAAHDVPTDFIYNTEHDATSLSGRNKNQVGALPRQGFAKDNEGGNGLVWSTDPRTVIVTTPALSGSMPYSAKYSKTSAGVLDPTQTIVNNPIRAADGLEARLIEAEADLAAGGANWLTILNTLRSTCIETSACAPVPGLTIASLPPLSDPGTADTRVDLLMKERAMWLYLTGHRQGDLRRLAHLYHRNPDTLWPIGTYSSPGFPPLIPASPGNGQLYGTSTVMGSRELLNPLYNGCFSYDP